MRYYAGFGELALEEADSVERAQEFLDGLRRFHVLSWRRRRKPHSFVNPFFETFHKALIRDCLPKGEIQFLRISAGEWTLGYLYNFRYKGQIYAYQSGFDDRDNNWRPGYVSHYLAINHNHHAGMRGYDLLAGDNRLKESFATSTYDMYWHRIYRPLFAYRVEKLLQRFKDRYLPRFRLAGRAHGTE